VLNNFALGTQFLNRSVELVYLFFPNSSTDYYVYDGRIDDVHNVNVREHMTLEDKRHFVYVFDEEFFFFLIFIYLIFLLTCISVLFGGRNNNNNSFIYIYHAESYMRTRGIPRYDIY